MTYIIRDSPDDNKLSAAAALKQAVGPNNLKPNENYWLIVNDASITDLAFKHQLNHFIAFMNKPDKENLGQDPKKHRRPRIKMHFAWR